MSDRPTVDTALHGRRAAGASRAAVVPVPLDPRNPGDEFLQKEIDDNRRSEFWLIPKAVLALAVVAVLVVIREVFFR